MVTCPKCGTKNEDDAKFCINCGVALYPVRGRERRGDTCFGWPERRVEEECFGLPYVGTIVGVVFGIFIILIGLGIAFGMNIGRWIGAFISITIGSLIIAGVVYRLRRGRESERV